MWRQEDKKSTVILCYITSSRSALDAWSPISKIGGGVTGCACLVDESSHEELVHLISCLKIFLLFVFCVMCVCMIICSCYMQNQEKGIRSFGAGDVYIF